MTSHITGSLQAVSVVTTCWELSLRFYTEALGYAILETGELSSRQKHIFSAHLGKYALLGHQEGSVVRLLDHADKNIAPIRHNARPWDCGMAFFEAGTPDVTRAYQKVIRARFGALVTPTEFDCEGPEPLGYVLMRSTTFVGPSGEQIFVTQIVGRKGGQSLLKENAIDGINTPANCVISVKDRQTQVDFWEKIIGIKPVNDLLLKQPGAAAVMGGTPDMGFDMCLMGHGLERVGMEQHVYEPHNPSFDFQPTPTTFDKTGMASAAWFGQDLTLLKQKLLDNQYEILGEVGLPIRNNPEPKALTFRGPYGEIIELIES